MRMRFRLPVWLRVWLPVGFASWIPGVAFLSFSIAASNVYAIAESGEPLVRRYMQGISAADSLSVDIVREDSKARPGAPVVSARLQFSRPNLYKLTVSRGGEVTEIVVSDGKVLRQWNTTHMLTEPAPTTLSGLVPSLNKFQRQFWGTAVLTMPELVASLRSLRDRGAETVDGAPTRKLAGKLNNSEVPGSVTLWLDDVTALPRRFLFEQGEHDDSKGTVTLQFHNPQTQAIAPATFSLRPPAGLAEQPVDPDYPKLAVGSTAPGFTLQTVAGRKISLKDFSGRSVLVEFWAPWCPGCRLSASTVNKITAEKGPKGLNTIWISTTAQKKELADYILDRPLQGWPVHDPDEMEQSVGYGAYKISGFPSFVVIDAKGHVAAVSKAYEEGVFEVWLRGAINRAAQPGAVAIPVQGPAPSRR